MWWWVTLQLALLLKKALFCTLHSLQIDVLPDPRVLLHLLCRISRFGIACHEFAHQILGLCADAVPLWRRELVLSADDHSVHFMDGVAVEGLIATEHNIQNDSDAPKVHLCRVLIAAQHFGRHVMGRPAARVHYVQPRLQFAQMRKAKVGHFENAALIQWRSQQNILGLQIAVDHKVRVQIRDAAR